MQVCCLLSQADPQSPSVCHGATGSVCPLLCAPGWGVNGTGGGLQCGADGGWSGAQCAPMPCTRATRLPHSPTVCEGSTGANCSYTCDEGYGPPNPLRLLHISYQDCHMLAISS